MNTDTKPLNSIKIYFNTEVCNAMDKLPKSLVMQMCYQFVLCEKDERIFHKTFKPIEFKGLKKPEPLKQLNFHFQGKNHRILGYNHNNIKKMGLLSYHIVDIGQKVSLEEIKSLREKAYTFTIHQQKQNQIKAQKIQPKQKRPKHRLT